MLTLLACLLAVVAVDRACLQFAPVADATHARAAAKLRASPTAAPAPLSSGVCQAFAPTGTGRGPTVFIDPGHGGRDPGVTGLSPAGAPVKESVVALAVAAELGRLLRADGYRVVLSRTADTSVVHFPTDGLNGGLSAEQVRQDLLARVRCANDAHAAALLSIHFNGYADPSVEGSQSLYDPVRPFAAENERLAHSLQTAMTSRLQLADRGLLADDVLVAPTLTDRASAYGHLLLLGPAEPGWLNQPTSMPGALVEPLFLTNRTEASLAASSAGQRRIAAALAAGVAAYLSGAPSQ
jgi:N-acetylmuramoyl-L-alanine amidase